MIFDHLDDGTFDAILRLYRSADPERAGAGRRAASAPSPARRW